VWDGRKKKNDKSRGEKKKGHWVMVGDGDKEVAVLVKKSGPVTQRELKRRETRGLT